VFGACGDFRVFDTVLQAADAVSEVMSRDGVLGDVVEAKKRLQNIASMSTSLLERGAMPGPSLPIFASSNVVARLTAQNYPYRPDAAVTTLSEHTLIGNAGIGAVRVRRLARPSGEKVAAPLTLVQTFSLGPGEAAAFDANRETFDFVELESNTVILTAVSDRILPTLREYDTHTLAYVRTVASSTSHSRIRFASIVLGLLPTPRGIEALTNLTAHPAHHVRWQAAQALASENYVIRSKTLKRLLEDPHRRVR